MLWVSKILWRTDGNYAKPKLLISRLLESLIGTGVLTFSLNSRLLNMLTDGKKCTKTVHTFLVIRIDKK